MIQEKIRAWDWAGLAGGWGGYLLRRSQGFLPREKLLFERKRCIGGAGGRQAQIFQVIELATQSRQYMFPVTCLGMRAVEAHAGDPWVRPEKRQKVVRDDRGWDDIRIQAAASDAG